jgi:hypothetical protein
MTLALGIVLSILAAGLLNLGFHAQHAAAHDVELSLRHPLASARRLASDRDWLIGYASGGLGWGCYIVALHFAPISVVQSVAAGGLGLLAVLAHRLGAPLARHERWGPALAVSGLILLFVSLSIDGAASHHARTGRLLTAVIATSLVAGAAAVIGLRKEAPGWILALSAGSFYAVSDLATKACLDGQVLVFLPFVLGGAALGFTLLQLSFPRGPVMATAGLASLANNALPIMGGVVLFHEKVPAGLPGVARVVGFAAVVAGAVLLARRPTLPVPLPEFGVAPPEASVGSSPTT